MPGGLTFQPNHTQIVNFILRRQHNEIFYTFLSFTSQTWSSCENRTQSCGTHQSTCTHSCGRAQSLLSVAHWLERRTEITGPQVRVLGLWLSFHNCSRFDFTIVYKISLYHHLKIQVTISYAKEVTKIDITIPGQFNRILNARSAEESVSLWYKSPRQ